MNFLTKTIFSQFVNKNIAFRAIYSSVFNAVDGNNSNRINITSNWPTKCSNCQQNPLFTTSFHNRSLTQFNFERSYSTATPTLSSSVTFGEKLKKFIGLHPDSKSNMYRSGYLLYETVCDKIDYPKFLKQFQKENTFYSWFVITELHVWMLMVRAMAEGDSGRIVRNSMVEAMWKDVELRTKKLGDIRRRVVQKQINELADQFEYTLIAYDEGITSDDKQLASAIWKQFLNSNCDDYVQVELLVKYVRENIAMLDKMPRSEFLYRQKVQWIDFTES